MSSAATTLDQYFLSLPDAFLKPDPGGETLTEAILRRLQGSSRNLRLGSMPSQETQGTIRANIESKVVSRAPLEVTCSWGATKTFLGGDGSVDFAEFLAFMQLESVADSVRSVYEPGVRFKVILSDSFHASLYGHSESVDQYCGAAERLGAQFPSITVKRMSAAIDNLPSHDALLEENQRLFAKYWQQMLASPGADARGPNELERRGWVGNVTQGSRDFYLKRMQLLYPALTPSQHVEKVQHFFAYSLLIKQLNLLDRASGDSSTADYCLLRVPPPGLPRALHRNRVRVRIAPVQVLSTSAPPWTVQGGVSVAGHGVASAWLRTSVDAQEIVGMTHHYGVSIPLLRREQAQ